MKLIKINILFVLLFATLLIGCTTQDILYSIEKYGEENAYAKGADGNIITLANPNATHFYIEIGSTYSNYRNISEYALSQASLIEGINFTYSYDTPTNASFTFYRGNSNSSTYYSTPVISDGCGLPGIFTKPGDISAITCSLDNENEVTVALNSLGYILDEFGENKIVYSHIVYYGDLMDELSEDEKKTIALHELGHTLGLRDYEKSEEEVVGYSVMYYLFTNIYDNYTEGDIYNLEWYYTYGGN